MLLLQVMMVAKLKDKKGQFCEYQDIIYVTIANEYGCHIQEAK